jgi:hypothetical protein
MAGESWTSDVGGVYKGGEEAQESGEELCTHGCEKNKQCFVLVRQGEMYVDGERRALDDSVPRVRDLCTWGIPLPLLEQPLGRLIPFIPLFRQVW